MSCPKTLYHIYRGRPYAATSRYRYKDSENVQNVSDKVRAKRKKSYNTRLTNDKKKGKGFKKWLKIIKKSSCSHFEDTLIEVKDYSYFGNKAGSAK